MLIYFAGPPEYMTAALAASQYCCARVAARVEEADALVLVWDGKDPKVKSLLERPPKDLPRFVYRVSQD
jgi:hypothetical protein